MRHSTQTRAMTLIEVTALLPVLAAGMLTTYLLMNRIERLQSRESAWRQDDAVLRDVVRRMQADAARADRADAQESAEGRSLVLHGPASVITYTAGAAGVTRTEQSRAGESQRYGWTMRQVALKFSVESIAGQPRLVWVTAGVELPADTGPEWEQTLSTAIALRPGGGS